MSRNIRRLQQLAAPDKINNESSEDEYVPLYTKRASTSTFSGLELDLSSASENDDKLPESSSEEEQKFKPKISKSKKRNNKQKQKKRSRRQSLNDVAKCVSEVNAILGEPAPQPVEQIPDKPDLKSKLFSISHKHLLSENELKRRFGPGERPTKRHGRQPNLKYIHTYTIISQKYNFERNGLSMTLDRREGGISYFIFEHSLEYQIRQRLLPTVINEDLFTLGFRVLEVSLKNMHIEGLIVAADKLFRMERLEEAYEIIERSIAFVQYFAHPGFKLNDINVRLEYKYFENRMFHILLLKYAYMTSTKACHRSALELVKLLLNLDPSDPLAVILIIDGLALRAKEYEWLIEVISFLDAKMHVGNLYNMKFSKALAYFYQARKGLEEMDKADELLQEALLIYPWALQPFTEHIKNQQATLRSHEFYSQFANNTTGENLRKLINLYVAFTATRWRKPFVTEWFLRNAHAVTEKVDFAQFTRKITDISRKYRTSLFKTFPAQVQRHLAVISSMAKTIIGEVPLIKFKHAYNPAPPPDSISRSGYPMPQTDQVSTPQTNPYFLDFFHSIFPSLNIDSDDDDEDV